MRKLIMSLVFLIVLLVLSVPAFADQRSLIPYSTSVSTYPITEVATIGAQLNLTAYIHHIIITNSDATVAQTVTFYKLGESTMTIVSDFAVDIASTSASGYVEPIQVPFPIAASPYKVKDLAIRKSDVSSTVRVTVFYR